VAELIDLADARARRASDRAAAELARLRELLHDPRAQLAAGVALMLALALHGRLAR
jgi:hypothetical protein